MRGVSGRGLNMHESSLCRCFPLWRWTGTGKGAGKGAAQGPGAVLDGQALSVGAVSHHARLPSCVNVC